MLDDRVERKKVVFVNQLWRDKYAAALCDNMAQVHAILGEVDMIADTETFPRHAVDILHVPGGVLLQAAAIGGHET